MILLLVVLSLGFLGSPADGTGDLDRPVTVELHTERKRNDTYAWAGGFRFENVHPGTYRIELRTKDTEWLVASVSDVEVVAGETTLDPRLQGLDLRGKLRLLRLRVERADGTPFAEERVELYVDREGGSTYTDDQGRLVALVRTEDENFLFGQRGYGPVELVWSSDEQLVVLEEE